MALFAYKALGVWRDQKKAEFIERFIRSFAKSRHYISYLRTPFSFDSEILPERLEMYKGEESLNNFNMYRELFKIEFRRHQNKDLLIELEELQSIVIMYDGSDEVISNYLQYILEIDRRVLSAANLLTINLETIIEIEGELTEINKIREENKKHKKEIYSSSKQDDIREEVDRRYNVCYD